MRSGRCSVQYSLRCKQVVSLPEPTPLAICEKYQLTLLTSRLLVLYTSAVSTISFCYIVMSALTKKQLEDVVTGLNQRLDGLLSKITALEDLPARLNKLEALPEASNTKHARLKLNGPNQVLALPL